MRGTSRHVSCPRSGRTSRGRRAWMPCRSVSSHFPFFVFVFVSFKLKLASRTASHLHPTRPLAVTARKTGKFCAIVWRSKIQMLFGCYNACGLLHMEEDSVCIEDMASLLQSETRASWRTRPINPDRADDDDEDLDDPSGRGHGGPRLRDRCWGICTSWGIRQLRRYLDACLCEG